MVGPRNFPRLVAASASSNLADGVFSLALPLVALSLTRDPAAFASVTVIGRLPWLLFALPAGALADRLDRRRTMLQVNLGRTVLIGLLAAVVLARSEGLWMLYVVAFVLGVGETLFDTAAQSILPSIVPAADLDRANGRLYAVELTANQFLGPPLGAIIAGATLAGAIAFSSALYLGAGLVLVSLTGTFRAVRHGAATTVFADVREGVDYLARHQLLRVFAACVGISNLASTAMIAILPLYLIRPGPGGFTETGYGLLLTTLAVGSVVGTVAVERLRRFLGVRRTLLLATLSFPLFSLVPALTTSGPVLALGFVVAGGIAVSWNIITVSIRQRIVPDHLLGRVNAGYRLVAWGTMPVGAALGGLTAAAFGLVPALVVSAAISALCFPLVLLGTPRDL